MSRIITIDFTHNFLDELTGYIEREYLKEGRSLDRLAIVFGGKRPAHFLRRTLARRINKGFVPPKFLTIDELMDIIANKSGVLAMGVDLDDRHEIYTLAREFTPQLLEGREEFAKFLPWAGDILDFISQLDLEDVSSSALKNIEESARIGYPVPENINRLLQNALTLRDVFHKRLRERGRTSRGLQYLRAKENVGRFPLVEYEEIIFANFFYFHKTEEAVVKDLYARGQATLIFQGDERKWPVLKRIAKHFSCELKEGAEPTPTTFDLKAYSAFDVHSEAAVVRDILSQIKDFERTVVILPDATAVVPLLSAMPEGVKDLNVSMGYPLKRSSLYLLLQSIFKAQSSCRDGRYYAKDLLAVFQHPFVKNLRLGSDPAVMRVLVHKIEEALKGRLASDVAGQSFVELAALEGDETVLTEAFSLLRGMGIDIGLDDLAKTLCEVQRIVFASWEDICDLNSFSRVLGKFLDVMSEKSFMKEYPLNINIASRMYEVKEELEKASFGDEPFSADEIYRIFEDKIDRELVSFSGTPLKGLQVLGLFETRSLNFDHVIIMDVNEGLLPRINVQASLIPREVMSQLSLDRLELEEEIQRYQFMRVISSAKTVHLVYQKNKEKGPSRFLEELIWEKQCRVGRLEPYPTMRAGFSVRVSGQRREAKKTPQILDFLKSFTYSASSINAYLNNPYQFYTTYVLGLRDEDDLLDEPDAALIGDFMHRLLEEAYQPLVGKPFLLEEAFAKRMWSLFEKRFEETFIRRMRSDAFLVRGVMEHKLRMFLEAEQERGPLIGKIIGLEEDFSGIISLSFGSVALKARVDRIEELRNGEILVLDYKTGNSDKLPKRLLRLSDSPTREDIYENVQSFQLLLYMYLVAKKFPGVRLNAGLYGLRDADMRLIFSEKFSYQPTEEFLAPYLKALDVVLSEIVSPDMPFVDDPMRDEKF
ncbi:MAG: PD-(D/E)XK nuclease family protein [Candidatus Omnitrophica bacterium]|nr:PD-(D/E)XK nuclease family protein [Candidatus Omnitrophota bacterium]